MHELRLSGAQVLKLSNAQARRDSFIRGSPFRLYTIIASKLPISRYGIQLSDVNFMGDTE
jgi:hypothetical protein